MAEQTLNIYQKLAKIRKQVEVIQKNKSGYGYKYVSDDELFAKITGFMDKYGISLIPGIVPGSVVAEPYTYKKTKKDKINGEVKIYDEAVNEFLVHGDMTYTWVNNDNPNEKIVVDWALVGNQGDGSQALGSSLTYSMRYFLLKFFNIATPEDDPDNWRNKQKAAEAAEDREIAAKIIEKLHTAITSFLESHQDKAEEVKKFVCKYIKSGNYFNITESTIAEKLYNDFADKYIKGE